MNKPRKNNNLFIKTEYLYKNRTFMLLMLLLLAITIPITVWQVQQRQDKNNYALELTVAEKESTISTSQYNTTVELDQFQRIQDGTKYLSSKDLTTRSTIVSKIPTSGDSEGIALATDNYVIFYDLIANDFTAEILTSDFSTAKKDVEDWFFKQGVSKQGICNLPLTYTLSPEIEGITPGTTFTTEPLTCGRTINNLPMTNISYPSL